MTSRRARFENARKQPVRVAIWQRDAWPALSWNESLLRPALARAQQAQLDLQAALLAIGFEGTRGLSQDLWTQEAWATAAIEGQNLDLAAVRSSVGHKLGLGKISGDRDVEGLVQVMQDASTQHAQPLTAARLCHWQALLFPGNADKPARLQIKTGAYRTHAEPMQIISGTPGREMVHYTAPASKDVPRQMKRLLQWLQATRPGQRPMAGLRRPPGLVRAALAHSWFETIHPFEDGNGRVGRALADYVLAQEFNQTQRVFSLSHQIRQERAAYYTELEIAQHAPLNAQGGLEVTRWVQWFTEVFTRGCEHSLSCIRLSNDKASFWQKAAGFEVNGRQRKVLQRLLDAGDGGFEGGLSAEKYMAITASSKATATRDLADLLASGLLRVRGQGKATRYAVALAGWNLDYA
jgi:Fic family protein